MILFPLLFLFTFVIAGAQSTLQVNAATQADIVNILEKIDDGITNWDYKTRYTNPKNEIGKIPIGDGLSLDYTFGSAKNQAGKVMAGDDTITKTDKLSNNLQGNSKINIFLEHNGQYYGIIHQNKDAYIGENGKPYTASDTSLDFAVVNGGLSLSGSNYGVMSKMTTKIFAVGHDSKKRTVLKIGGPISNLTDMYAEVVLRPDPTGAPIVRRELYLYNNGSSEQDTFQVYFGEDTALGKDPSIIDDVPLYAIGNDEGLYMYDTQTPSNSGSKLYVTNNVPDGFTSYIGKAYMDSAHWDLKGYAEVYGGGQIASPNLKYGDTTNGDNGRVPGSKLLFGKKEHSDITYPVVNKNSGEQLQDSAYTLRWPYVEDNKGLKPGKTFHYASTMGATLAGYPIPSVSKTYTNTTPHSDGLNHVGDKLKFTLKAQNNGLKSHWSLIDIKDALPTGLKIDPDSITYKWTEMNTSGSGNTQKDREDEITSGTIPSMYVTDNTLDYTPFNTVLKEKDRYYVTFYATVDNKAPTSAGTLKYLTNEATFTGYNADTNKDRKDVKDSVNIPIDVNGFNYNFTNQVRNITADPNSAFSDNVDATTGDILEIKSVLTANVTINNGGKYINTTNIGYGKKLQLISGSVTLNGVAQSDSLQGGIVPGITTANQPNTFIFRVKVNSKIDETVENYAQFLGASNFITGEALTFGPSDSAYVHVHPPIPTTSFIEVPELIDFGSINSTGTEKMLTNKQTKGNLIVSHSAETPYQVLVSYDNSGDQALTNNNEKLIQDDGLSLLLDNNSNEEPDDWEPLSTTGIPINNQEFIGSDEPLDLTKYIGFDKWKLRVPSTAKSGQYNGEVTWTIADTPIE